MEFNSLLFLIFFPCVVIIYFLLQYRLRWIWLLLASYYFYMCWKPAYLFLIIVSTLIDYTAGIKMGQTQNVKKRRKYLILSLLTNLGLLFSFKYYNFFSDSLRTSFNHFNIFINFPVSHLLLPVGISFYTFQTLSYTIDVYRGKKKPEKHLGIFALYVAFFPQLVAGPIERSTRLLPQFFKKYDFDFQRVTDGLKLMLWGLFKKLVIADRVAILVNQVYNNPHNYTGFPLIIASYAFAFQIFCDFSGYSDIAIGASQVMGFKLMDNFKSPYFAKSISEFWHRWHISLSTWFRDYLYIPLGGNRVKKPRWYFNLFTVFLISGLWHGANWTFVIWGGLHGFYLLFSIWTKNIRNSISSFFKIDKNPFIQKIIKVFITFHLVLFGWIFFRGNNIHDVFYILKHFFDFSGRSLKLSLLSIMNLGLAKEDLFVGFCAILFMEIVHLIERKQDFRKYLSSKPLWLRWSVYLFIIFAVILFSADNKSAQFIYFQF